jgi:hypothetical protein
MKTLTATIFATAVLAGALVGLCDAQTQRPHLKPQVPPTPVYQPQQPVFQQMPVYQPQQQVFQPMPVYQGSQVSYQPPMSQNCFAGQLFGILPQFFPVGTQCTVTDQYGNVWGGIVR